LESTTLLVEKRRKAADVVVTDSEDSDVVRCNFDWPKPCVSAPDSRPIADFLRQLDEEGFGDAIAEGRKALAGAGFSEPNTLRNLRLRVGLSQAQLAEKIGTSQPQVARLEAGTQEPTLKTLRRISDALGVDLNTLGTAFHAR